MFIEIQEEIDANEATIAQNNHDADSISNVKKKAVEEMEMKLELGLYEPEPGDPKIGLAIVRARDLAKTDKIVEESDKKVGKLQKTNDSLKKENNKKRAEIYKRGYLPKQSNKGIDN